MIKQTAIDWLIEQIGKGKIEITKTDVGNLIGMKDNVYEQAKGMEKEQMFAYTRDKQVIGEYTDKFFTEDFEQYYNETYNKINYDTQTNKE